jgi:mRNA interferase HicA
LGQTGGIRRARLLTIAHCKHNTNVARRSRASYGAGFAKQGRTFETHKGGSGHLTVIRGDRRSQLPMHGSKKDLGSGLVAKIKKDLGRD